jgi:hypothetical protein
MVGSQKVPRMVVFHSNDRIYSNAYLLTFTVEPLYAHAHTHTHAHVLHHPATVGSTGRRLLLELSGVRL